MSPGVKRQRVAQETIGRYPSQKNKKLQSLQRRPQRRPKDIYAVLLNVRLVPVFLGHPCEWGGNSKLKNRVDVNLTLSQLIVKVERVTTIISLLKVLPSTKNLSSCIFQLASCTFVSAGKGFNLQNKSQRGCILLIRFLGNSDQIIREDSFETDTYCASD